MPVNRLHDILAAWVDRSDGAKSIKGKRIATEIVNFVMPVGIFSEKPLIMNATIAGAKDYGITFSESTASGVVVVVRANASS